MSKTTPVDYTDTVRNYKARVLVVDDEENVRQFLKGFFNQRGHEISVASSGEEAIRLVSQEHPSIVLLDIYMPGMNGLVTLKRIREMDPSIDVVMVTGIQDESMAKEAIQLGAYDYIPKPFDLKYLELIVLTRLLLTTH